MMASPQEWLKRYVRDSSSPMLLIELPEGAAVEASSPMLELTGMDRQTLLRMSSPSLTQDPSATRVSLGLLAEGTLMGYSRRVAMPHPQLGTVQVDVRVDACGGEPQSRWAIATVLPTEAQETSSSRDKPQEGSSSSFRLMGTLDRDGVIDRVVGGPPISVAGPRDALLGVRLVDLVHPLDAGVILLLLAQCDTRQLSATAQTRSRLLSDEWQVFQLTLHKLLSPRGQRSSGYAFAICPALAGAETPDADTHALLERNALEYRAVHAISWLSSWLPIGPRATLNDLTDRELEIVARLLGGQRVSGIARDLFLSQSTVRNHLSAVYRKFGVRSQAQLLEMFHAGD